MWATNNSHEEVVKVLLEHGASSQTKSSKGRTVFDFVNTDNQKIVDILATNPRDSISSTSSIFGRNGSSQSSSSSNAGDYDFYYQSTVEGYDSFMTEETERRKKLLESAMNLGTNEGDDMDNMLFDQYDNGDEDDDTDDITNDFQWDRCLPDQMFVFGADDLSYILDTVITNIQLPMRSQHEICIPANVIFLSARFAHYFSTEELLNEVMDGSLERMTKTIKVRTVSHLSSTVTHSLLLSSTDKCSKCPRSGFLVDQSHTATSLPQERFRSCCCHRQPPAESVGAYLGNIHHSDQ
jgi:hypothetical protein